MKPRPLAELLAMPLQSAVRAQAMASDETLRFVRDFGTKDGAASTFSIRVPRMVEETVKDPVSGKPVIRLVEKPIEVRVPLLALVPMPGMQLGEMNVDVAVKVIELQPEAVTNAAGGKDVTLASSPAVFTSLARLDDTTMKISLRIVQRPPEGLSRVADLLTELLGQKTPIEKPGLKVLRGLDEVQERRLLEHGLDSLERIAELARRADAIPRVAERLGVTEDRLRSWIDQSADAVRTGPNAAKE